MKNKTLYLIGNAHIDPVWLWNWQEGFHEVHATFRSALDRLGEYDEFIFTASSAAFYEWIEQIDPAMFAEIQQRVAEGRWGLVGGWWIEPDCNIPGGESFVRQGLYGQRYFQHKFGRLARTGYNPDSFGHHALLPQILRKSGLENYVFMRPGTHEKDLPGRVFFWQAPDGSQVLTAQIPFGYGTWGELVTEQLRQVAGVIPEQLPGLLCFYGVGDHGGGPTRINLDNLRQLQTDPDLPALCYATPDTYFDALRDNPDHIVLPIVREDLQHHARGCYAAHSGVKRWNRQAEHSLLTAEKMATLAERLLGVPYPQVEFERAWKNVLFNQFHDSLAGTSLESDYEAARNTYGEALAIAERATNTALQALAWQIDTPTEPRCLPLLVFNPHAFPNRSAVEFELANPASLMGEPGYLLDEQGNQVSLQCVQPEATVPWGKRLCFVADLPALGYRLYRIHAGQPVVTPAEAAPREQAAPVLRASDTTLENQFFRLEIDPQTGYLVSLQDKRHGVQVFSAAAARPVVYDDFSDTWSHDVARFDQGVGEFKAVEVRLVEQGPVRATIRVTSAYGRSSLVQDFSLYASLEQIDVKATLDWREHFKLLKLRFPLHLALVQSTYEIPYGHIVRVANGDEEPGGSWLDLSGLSRDTWQPYGLSLLNDSKYSQDVTVNEIGFTVVRSPIYAHHFPQQPQAGVDYTFMDQGLQRFCYRLLPHAGGWQTAGTVQRAQDLNQPALALAGTFHPGRLPQTGSFLMVEPANVIATVLKRAEDNDDLILRCVETSGSDTAARISLFNGERVIETQFKSCEIKTFRLPRQASMPIVETNLIESTCDEPS